MEIRRLDYIPPKVESFPVKVTTMGNVVEVQYMSRRNNRQSIQLLPGGNSYVVLSTGEIREIEHKEVRSDSKKSLYQTFSKVRALINCNVTDVSCVRWCTLTYAENMTDTKRLYDDFRKFNLRFQYYCKKNGFGTAEYIVMMEPQGRGAWHAHLLYIWDKKAPYIPNNELERLWGYGFVKIKKLDNVDNVGAYLTAYLGDMEIENYNGGSCNVKEVEVEQDGKKVKKKFLKGARLNLYPSNFNLFRCSRGVKRPVIDMMSQKEAEKKVMAGTKTFESAIELIDNDSDYDCVIVKEYYNLVRK